MKAILQYGQFSAMIELPERLLTVSIMKPMDSPSILPLETTLASTEVMPSRLEFRLREQLTDDYWLYEFVGEY